MKIRKGDNIVVMAGKNRGQRGKVLRALPRLAKVIVEGANLAKKRQRPRRQGQKGQVVQVAMPIDISNVLLWCARCSRGVRSGSKREGNKKLRICRRCRTVLEPA